MFSQNLSGTLYDAEAPISGAKIMNITSKSISSTKTNGTFEIYAKLNDTLLFSSLFHHTKSMVVISSHLEELQVFELKKIINELDEVDIIGPVSKKIDEKEMTSRTEGQFKTDLERNPHLYRRPNVNSGPIDFIEIGRRVAKLFKRKTPKEENVVVTALTADHLNTLFKSDPFFNDSFLILNLDITKDYKHLFFTYCETKDLTSTFMEPENRIYLVDKFLTYSQEFRALLIASQKL